LLVVVVGENVIFDPSREELAVADGVIAVSIGNGRDNGEYKLLAVRMIDTPARDTMKGVHQTGEMQEGAEVPGVWTPWHGGLKRSVLKAVVKAVLAGGVARDVMAGLDGFLTVEANAEAAG
jgi:exosome complex component RRP42